MNFLALSSSSIGQGEVPSSSFSALSPSSVVVSDNNNYKEDNIIDILSTNEESILSQLTDEDWMTQKERGYHHHHHHISSSSSYDVSLEISSSSLPNDENRLRTVTALGIENSSLSLTDHEYNHPVSLPSTTIVARNDTEDIIEIYSISPDIIIPSDSSCTTTTNRNGTTKDPLLSRTVIPNLNTSIIDLVSSDDDNDSIEPTQVHGMDPLLLLSSSSSSSSSSSITTTSTKLFTKPIIDPLTTTIIRNSNTAINSTNKINHTHQIQPTLTDRSKFGNTSIPLNAINMIMNSSKKLTNNRTPSSSASSSVHKVVTPNNRPPLLSVPLNQPIGHGTGSTDNDRSKWVGKMNPALLQSSRSSNNNHYRNKNNSSSHSVIPSPPFYKRVPGTSFIVDGFRYASSTVSKYYFLTHYHSDHYEGLSSRTFTFGTIYCSGITANLLRMKLRMKGQYIQAVPLDTSFILTNVRITFIDANHCPGAVMILFEVPMMHSTTTLTVVNTTSSSTSSRTPMSTGTVTEYTLENFPPPSACRAYLHTGDMRFYPGVIFHPRLQPYLPHLSSITIAPSLLTKLPFTVLPSSIRNSSTSSTIHVHNLPLSSQASPLSFPVPKPSLTSLRRLETVYMDTTYCNPSYAFPPQPSAIAALKLLLEPFKSDPHILLLFGAYSIGKERLWFEAGRILNERIYVDPVRMRTISFLSIPKEDMERLTTDPKLARIRIVPMSYLSCSRLTSLWRTVRSEATAFVDELYRTTHPPRVESLAPQPVVLSTSSLNLPRLKGKLKRKAQFRGQNYQLLLQASKQASLANPLPNLKYTDTLPTIPSIPSNSDDAIHTICSIAEEEEEENEEEDGGGFIPTGTKKSSFSSTIDVANKRTKVVEISNTSVSATSVTVTPSTNPSESTIKLTSSSSVDNPSNKLQNANAALMYYAQRQAQQQKEYVRYSYFHSIVAFRPTGWAHSTKTSHIPSSNNRTGTQPPSVPPSTTTTIVSSTNNHHHNNPEELPFIATQTLRNSLSTFEGTIEDTDTNDDENELIGNNGENDDDDNDGNYDDPNQPLLWLPSSYSSNSNPNNVLIEGTVEQRKPCAITLNLPVVLPIIHQHQYQESIQNIPIRITIQTRGSKYGANSRTQTELEQFRTVIDTPPLASSSSSSASSSVLLTPSGKFASSYLPHGGITLFSLPYSEHSSFSELRLCNNLLQPTSIIPTVNCRSNDDFKRIVGLLRR